MGTSIWRAAWWQVRSRFRRREATAREEQLRLQLDEALARIRDLEFEGDKLKSLNRLLELEVAGLVGVNERNQQRVNAETAEWSQRAMLAGLEQVRRA